MIPVVFATGFMSFSGKATLQMGGGSATPSKSFFVDNLDSPGNYTAAAFVPFNAQVVAMDGASPDLAYAGVVDFADILSDPPGGIASLYVDDIQNADAVTWVNGVAQQSIEWVFNDPAVYTIQLTDGTTTTLVQITVS